ncbi:hypothetical protein DOTSEDRAFT_70134 [Dothistroma septosporum NZE10]|uniref:Uncharacterized protein n=1 Tax=Dothistroma septosporum (strain NZE10 / CBS 128990) TaxID=675120 RepID=N1PRH0_DOTSN|nr:hypothetical protein DOTSEDRAFT_70134 [Dothistroma septosporum NZE10]
MDRRPAVRHRGPALLSAISDSYDPGPETFITFFVRLCGESSHSATLAMCTSFSICGLNISKQPPQGGIHTLMHVVVPKWAQSWAAALNGIVVAFGTNCGYLLASSSFGLLFFGPESEVLRSQTLSFLVATLVCSAITVI